MEYQEERGNLALFKEAFPLLQAHAEELNTLSTPLDPDYSHYLKAANTGKMAIFTVRDKGELVGYACYWILRHPHYDVTVADQDILFLREDLRHGRTGLKLIKFSEKILEAGGVDVITQRTKKHKDLGKLFKYLGYELTEEVYTKEI